MSLSLLSECNAFLAAGGPSKVIGMQMMRATSVPDRRGFEISFHCLFPLISTHSGRKGSEAATAVVQGGFVQACGVCAAQCAAAVVADSPAPLVEGTFNIFEIHTVFLRPTRIGVVDCVLKVVKHGARVMFFEVELFQYEQAASSTATTSPIAIETETQEHPPKTGQQQRSPNRVLLATMTASGGPFKGEMIYTRNTILSPPPQNEQSIKAMQQISAVMNPKRVTFLSLIPPTLHAIDLVERRLWCTYSVSPEMVDKHRGLQGALSAAGDNAVTALLWALSLSGTFGPPRFAHISSIEIHTSYFQPCTTLNICAVAKVVAQRDQVIWLLADLYSSETPGFEGLKLVAQLTTTGVFVFHDLKPKL